MRILFLEWNSIGNDYIKKEFVNHGIDVYSYDVSKDLSDKSTEDQASALVNSIVKEQPDFVFSFNYFVYAAIACQACKVLYVSWTYDSPYVQLFSKTISFPTNIAFVFDNEIVQKLNGLGAENVFYLPMCAPVEEYDKMIPSASQHQMYDASISMIGSTYTERKNNLFDRYIDADEYTEGYLEGLLRSQQHIFGMSVLESGLTNEITDKLGSLYSINPNGYETPRWIIANYILARKLTSYERLEYIKTLSERFDKTIAIYTHESTPDLKKVANRGVLDYYDHMPYAIKCSDINLNISLRSIVNAIPLRVFDIMGCDAFCLSSYQGELFDFFSPGEDFDYYDSPSMLFDKCEYYLKNEKERKDIARNAYIKVKQNHTYKKRVETILGYLDELL